MPNLHEDHKDLIHSGAWQICSCLAQQAADLPGPSVSLKTSSCTSAKERQVHMAIAHSFVSSLLAMHCSTFGGRSRTVTGLGQLDRVCTTMAYMVCEKVTSGRCMCLTCAHGMQNNPRHQRHAFGTWL